MYRLDIRADNLSEQGDVVIIEATPLAHKIVATVTREKARGTLEMLGLSETDILHIMRTFEDGKERMMNIEGDSSLFMKAGFA